MCVCIYIYIFIIIIIIFELTVKCWVIREAELDARPILPRCAVDRFIASRID
jgi:hypothetical protein